jgi:hypothetical protein
MPLNPKEFRKSVSRIYATQPIEPDCQETQATLPAFVEAEFSGTGLASIAVDVEAHLFQCPDCMETYQGLRYLIALTESGALDDIEAFDGALSSAFQQLEPGELTPIAGS